MHPSLLNDTVRSTTLPVTALKFSRRRSMKSSDDLLSEVRAINASLNRSKEHLQVSVFQSETAAQLLEADGQVLSGALHDHKVELRTTLQSTKRRLDRIKMAEKWEQLAMTLSLSLFTLVVVYIFLSRLRILVSLQYFLMGSCHSVVDENVHGEL